MSGTPEVAAASGDHIDGSVIQWWGWKADAVAGARSIGWPVNSVWSVRTRFQHGYALHQTHGGFLTRGAFAALRSTR